MSNELCRCGSLLAYSQCCEPLHQGMPAANPEALMRSRFCAFAMGNVDYLLKSWHSSTRPAPLELDGAQWFRLEVLSQSQSGDSGQVHFKAYFSEGGSCSVLEEQSNFVREGGHWFYVDGDASVSPFKLQRNDPCYCGSGKKFKKCCGVGSGHANSHVKILETKKPF